LKYDALLLIELGIIELWCIIVS